jgi:prophage maintenance system killer protein
MTSLVDITSGEILVYEAPDGSAQVDVRLDQETVWLNQEQMAELFGRERSVVTKHIRNVFKEGELDPKATSAKFAQVRSEGGRTVTRDVDHYNLDVIISVGYRVKSQSGTQFRIWATRTLREHLVRGYTLNQQRFARNAAELEAALNLVRRAAVARLKADLFARGEATELFGREPKDGLAALLGNLDQSVFGDPAYPTIESKAAHLLYFVVKNHPFIDGNKRIGSFLFVDFLNRNGRLFRHGEVVINDVGLAVLALLVAESAPKDKDVMIRLVMHMLTGLLP